MQPDRPQPALDARSAPTAFALRNIADRKARGRLRAAATAEAVGSELEWTDADGWRYQLERPPVVTISPKDIHRAAATVDLRVWDAGNNLIFRDRIHAWDGFPVLVPDGSEHEEDDGLGGKVRVSNFRESPVEAARLDLAHTVRVAVKNGPWVKDKPGTVSTFYSGTSDNQIENSSTTYSSAREGSGSWQTWATTELYNRVGQYVSGGTYYVRQGFLEFDTSPLSGEAASAVALSLYSYIDTTNDFIIEARFYSWGAAVGTEDFVAGSSLSTHTRAATYDTASGFAAGSYYTFSEDGSNFQSGLNTSGYTQLLLSSDQQRTGSAPTGVDRVAYRTADYTGTTQDPKLVVTHTAATPPTITSGPTTTYASGTATTPTVTWGVTFTATDAEQTGTDALTYYIRTSSTFGGGTQVATGTCTSGSSKAVTGLAYNASGVVVGSQTLYLHIYDGALNTVTAGSFTLLRIDAKPFRRALLGVGV